MDNKTFGKVVEKQYSTCCQLLQVKESEYSLGKDRLDQFKRGSEFTGQHPLQVLAGMMLKHTTSIYDMVNRASSGEMAELTKWSEKISDHINYLFLMRALLEDLIPSEADSQDQ